MYRRISFIACLATMVGGPVSAGSYPAAVVEPFIAVPAAPIQAWAGAYGGVTLGHHNMTVEDLTFGPGSFDASGGALGGFVGYNWQSGNLVFGPELGLRLTRASGNDGAFLLPFRMRNSVEVRGRLGYDAGNLMPYVALGYVSSQFWADHDGLGNPDDYASGRHTGHSLALGIDAMVNDQMFIRGEAQSVRYRNRDLSFYGGTDPHTIRARDVNFSLGIGWRF